MGSSCIAQGDQLSALWPPRGVNREGGRETQNEESDIQNGRFLLGKASGINTLISYMQITLNSFSLMLVCFNSISLKKKTQQLCLYDIIIPFLGALKQKQSLHVTTKF